MQQPPAERIATCCSEALFGYAEAAAAMWWAATHETIDACGRMVKVAVPVDLNAKPKSWFNPDAHIQTSFAANDAASLAAVMPWMGLFGKAPAAKLPPALIDPANWFPNWPKDLFGSPLPAVAPFAVWLDMFPLRGGPAAWPMAYFMLSAGIPKAVAWPTATANAAMMEAAEVVTGQMQGAFASYRSEGGHASAANANGWVPMTPTMAAYASFVA